MKHLLRTTMLVALCLLVAVGGYAQTTTPQQPRKSLKILAIGNSFSRDAAEQHLWELFDAAGIEVVIGNLYIGGCSLERHWSNAEQNKPAYEYFKNVGGKNTMRPKTTLKEALQEEAWDIITVQQVSGQSGFLNAYQPYLAKMIDYIEALATNPAMKIWFHQTWAYATTSNHPDFPRYERNQTKMYEAIMGCSCAVLIDAPELYGVIPSGTAIQNMRTTPQGDALTRDGFHLNYNHGRYTAACTWFESLSGESVVGNSYTPAKVSPEQKRWAQWAAHAAVQNPYSVTPYRE